MSSPDSVTVTLTTRQERLFEMSSTISIIPCAQHPVNTDRAAHIVWEPPYVSANKRNPLKRHCPAVYSTAAGYVLTWAEGSPTYTCNAVLEPFPSAEAAIEAWENEISLGLPL